MNRFIYILTDCRRQNLHIGMTDDLNKTIGFYRIEANLLFDASAKVSRLVYFEKFESDEKALARFALLRSYTRMQKERLIRSVNNNWRDLSLPLHHPGRQLSEVSALRYVVAL